MSVTDALLLHWQETVQRHRPPQLTVTTGEVAFLLLWLQDTTPVESVLLDLAQRYYRQEEYEWDETWGSETWTPFVNRVRSSPMQSLLTYATQLGALLLVVVHIVGYLPALHLSIRQRDGIETVMVFLVTVFMFVPMIIASERKHKR